MIGQIRIIENKTSENSDRPNTIHLLLYLSLANLGISFGKD